MYISLCLPVYHHFTKHWHQQHQGLFVILVNITISLYHIGLVLDIFNTYKIIVVVNVNKTLKWNVVVNFGNWQLQLTWQLT